MDVESKIKISEHLNDLLIYRFVGDIGTARSIHTEWYRGNITHPTLGVDKVNKQRLRCISSAIKTNLPLPDNFTGAVDFHVNQGRLVKTDVKTQE